MSIQCRLSLVAIVAVSSSGPAIAPQGAPRDEEYRGRPVSAYVAELRSGTDDQRSYAAYILLFAYCRVPLARRWGLPSPGPAGIRASVRHFRSTRPSTRTEYFVTHLVTALADSSRKVRNQVLVTLLRMGPQAIRAEAEIRSLLESGDPGTRLLAGLALYEIAADFETAARDTLRYLGHPKTRVRVQALSNVSSLARHRRAHGFRRRVRILLSDPSTEVRTDAARVLGDLDYWEKRRRARRSRRCSFRFCPLQHRRTFSPADSRFRSLTVSDLIAQLARGTSYEKCRAALWLAYVFHNAPRWREAHRVHFAPQKSERPFERLECAYLGHASPRGKVVIPALVRALRDESARVRIAALESLGRIGPEAATHEPEILAIRDDPDAAVRTAATAALTRIQR